VVVVDMQNIGCSNSDEFFALAKYYDDGSDSHCAGREMWRRSKYETNQDFAETT